MNRILLASLLFVPGLAAASPWVLQPGDWVLAGRYDYQIATTEFLDEPEAVPFSLRGRYTASTYAIGARAGLAPGLEIALEIPLVQVTYTADPVIPLPHEGPPDEALDYYQENIINLSTSRTGLGDIRVGARYQLTGGAFASALGLQLKTPTGYDPPAGTFGDRPKSREDLLADIRRFVAPENVRDDVTLGDGQVDLTGRLLLGWAMASRTFVRLDAGYVLRLGGAGDQVEGALRVGQLIGRRLLIFAGAEAAIAIQDGEVIGVSVAAEDPTLPAADYFLTDNLLLREVRLDHDRISLPVGAIIRLAPPVELNVAYSPIIWGRNIARVHTVSLGVAVKGGFFD